ncbi:MAG: transglutaminase domain-containing protein [Acetobacteraceae bacterium]|nr:transglutaminase domain-containing protein [Acetobacteraceae bacterium]
MNRRRFLAAAAAAPIAAQLGWPHGAEAAEGWRLFEVRTRVTLLDSHGAAQLWLPLAQTAGGYQTALDLDWSASGRTKLVHDARYGADILYTAWDGREAAQTLDVVQRVATRDRGGSDPLLPLTEADRRFWTAPTPSAPTDGIVRETAERIIAGKAEPRARLRALYDWVVDNTWRDPATPGCGYGNVEAMLRSGRLGGKCADINGLMTALARAAGFPARDVYGVRVADSRVYPSLGRSGDVSTAQHCRAEAYLDDIGWVPLDPADVRKVVLEQKLAVDSPEIRVLRDRLFGTWEMNWIGYNSATDVELPGAGQRKTDFAFLMYPCAFTADGQPNCLDPAHFRYEITSREIAA